MFGFEHVAPAGVLRHTQQIGSHGVSRAPRAFWVCGIKGTETYAHTENGRLGVIAVEVGAHFEGVAPVDLGKVPLELVYVRHPGVLNFVASDKTEVPIDPNSGIEWPVPPREAAREIWRKARLLPEVGWRVLIHRDN